MPQIPAGIPDSHYLCVGGGIVGRSNAVVASPYNFPILHNYGTKKLGRGETTVEEIMAATDDFAVY
jgi:hypothetical protein